MTEPRDELRARLAQALSEMLALFPPSVILQEITPTESEAVRLCPLTRTPSVAEIYRWRAVLAAAPPEGGEASTKALDLPGTTRPLESTGAPIGASMQSDGCCQCGAYAESLKEIARLQADMLEAREQRDELRKKQKAVYVPPPFDKQELTRRVAGAVECAIADHGPITRDNRSSLTKRIVGELYVRQAIAASAAELLERAVAAESSHDELVKALRSLVDAVHRVASSDEFKGAFTIADLHGVPYTGPNFLEEWQAARDLLECIAGEDNTLHSVDREQPQQTEKPEHHE